MGRLVKYAKFDIRHLQESLEKASNHAPSLLPTLENHHHYLRDALAPLLDPTPSSDVKIAALRRLLTILPMHAKAEEETLYAKLLGDESRVARLAAMSGQGEHDIAGYLGDELEGLRYEENWSEEIEAKAKVLAGTVRAHLDEEVSVLFPFVKHHYRSEELHALGEAYVEKCRNFLEEKLSPLSSSTPNGPTSGNHSSPF